MEKKFFNFKGFNHLDDEEEAQFLVQSMAQSIKMRKLCEIKKTIIKQLDIKKGDSILELGCGFGYDAALLSEYTGEEGCVVAVDNSYKMLEEAKKLFQINNVTFLKQDANHLSLFPDNAFSCCHIERLLLSQQNPEQVLSEAFRVLKPKGKISITEPNFDSIVLYPHHGLITDEIIAYWKTLVEHPLIGLDLEQLLLRFNKPILFHDIHTYESKNYDAFLTINPLDKMLDDMTCQNIISASDAETVMQDMKAANNLGDFFYSIEFHTYIAQKQGGDTNKALEC